MKILMSAYACEPGRGSEPGVGWNVAREVAKYCQVWVLTSPIHRPGIEAELACNPIPNLNFVYVAPFGWVYDLIYGGKRVQWGIYFHYYLWQIWAYFVALPLHREIGFNLVHHVTFVKYSAPSFLALLPIPFLWGPVGGGESAPRAFWKDFSLGARAYETLRNLARWFGEQDPFVHITARRSRLALATTEDTAKRLQQVGVKKVQVCSAIGLSEVEIASLSKQALSQSFSPKFISMARLLHWKGLHLGLRAFAQAKLPDAEYWILGDGPEQKHLQALTEELGISTQVKFWGTLPRAETLQKLGKCLALVHPSLHDSGGWVCLEAMAAGRPVICLELGGPATQVTNKTGFKVAAHTPEQAVCDLAKAMVHFAKDPELLLCLGHAGRKWVQSSYSWEKKGLLLIRLYEEILAQPSPLC